MYIIHNVIITLFKTQRTNKINKNTESKVTTMNSNLWTVISAKVNYDLQKNARGGGIIGIGLFFLFFIMWEKWFYPIFDALGIVDFARNAGLVQETYVGTFFSIAAILFVLLVITTLLVFSGTIISTLFLCLPAPLQALIVAPIILIAMPFITVFQKFKGVTNKKKEMEMTKSDYFCKEDLTIEEYYAHVADDTEREEYEALKHYPKNYLHGKLYFNHYGSKYPEGMKQLTYADAYKRLNSAVSTLNSPQNYVVAYTEQDGGAWYILGPQPLPAYVSSVVRYNADYSMKDVKLALSKYNESANLYVPAQEIYFYWKPEEKYYRWQMTGDFRSVPKDYQTRGNNGMMPLRAFSDFYHANELHFPQFYRSETLLKTKPTIQRAHELAYLIPTYFEGEWIKFATNQPNFMNAVENIPNYETFNLVHMPAVEKKLKELAKNGDMEAVEAYHRVQANIQNNNN